MSGVFVTGTDTDCGKTLIAAGLMVALQARGLTVLGMKPVASGCRLGPDGPRSADALVLLAHGSVQVPYALANTYALVPPVAPHIAAGEAGVEIEIQPLVDAYRALAGKAQWVVVEGVGGWRVPLGPTLSVSDLPLALAATEGGHTGDAGASPGLAATEGIHTGDAGASPGLGLPVVMVTGLKLGCINHSLLTAESIAARGARLAGWVANQVDPAMLAPEQNIATLAALIDAPCLGVVPYLHEPTPEQVAGYLKVDRLLS
jgi:dethiobiotin synthetase